MQCRYETFGGFLIESGNAWVSLGWEVMTPSRSQFDDGAVSFFLPTTAFTYRLESVQRPPRMQVLTRSSAPSVFSDHFDSGSGGACNSEAKNRYRKCLSVVCAIRMHLVSIFGKTSSLFFHLWSCLRANLRGRKLQTCGRCK